MDNNIVIQLEHVDIMQSEHLVLKDVNFSISKSEFVFLIGKTGSGKSSILKTIYGELPLKLGEATVAGYDLKKIKSKQIPFLRRKLGIVFQDFQLLTDRSVEKNLEFVLKATGWNDKTEISDRITQVLEFVELGRKGYRMPYELSGGEQQRVAIARALLNKPEIILADEPTGNLDPEISHALMELFHRIKDEGTAVIMATHNMPLIEKFPARILRCVDDAVIDLTPDLNLSPVEIALEIDQIIEEAEAESTHFDTESLFPEPEDMTSDSAENPPLPND